MQDWIRGKIPYFIAPPEPDNRDKDGKPLPKPLKVATETAVAKPVATKSTASGGTNALTGGEDALGNSVKSIKGVTQPLHQIVRSNKFMADDEHHAPDEEDEEEEEVPVVEGAEEEGEWEGIESDEDDEEVGSDEESFFEEEDDTEPPLQWDDLFDTAVGEAEGAGAGDTSVASVASKTSTKSKRGSSLLFLHFFSS